MLWVRGWRRFEGGRIVRLRTKGESGMPSSLMFAISFAALLSGSGNALAQTSPTSAVPTKAEQPFNIGFVLYTKGKVPGTLDARWNYGNAYSGHGVATGGPVSGAFAGRYHVRYFLESGEFSDEYDLDIKRHTGSDFYDLMWIANGKVIAKGVGMEIPNDGRLAVGWRRVAD